MKYACLVYQDPSKLAGMSEAQQLAAIGAACAVCDAWKVELEKSGRLVFCAGLQSLRTAATVRNVHGKVVMTDGPFAETKEFLGGFTIIEARDFTEALQIASRIASALLTIEVRPVMDADAELTDPFDRKIAEAAGRRAT